MVHAIAFVIPIFLSFALVEWLIAARAGKNLFSTSNTILNLSLGAIDQVCSLCIFAFFYFTLQYIYDHYRLFELKQNWLQWVLAYVAIDFISYWYHRFSHEINFLWAGHVTHHSSEHYNYTTGFRVSPFQGFNRIVFWAVLPFLGFSPLILIVCFKVSGIFDFFQHTQTVSRLGFIEKIFITPSTHRVHHGKNDIYIDKNYGSNFVIWDKMFGTYQAETEPVQYGIKDEQYVDNNPLQAIFHHYIYLWQTAKRAARIKDKLWLFLKRPNWKPEHLQPVAKSDEKSLFYEPVNIHKYYALMQLIFCSAGIILIMAFEAYLSVPLLITFAATALAGMVNSALIFNGVVKTSLRTAELVRLIITSFVFVTFYLVYGEYYLLLIAGFLLLSAMIVYKFPYASASDLVPHQAS